MLDLRSIRRTLHAKPELSGQEVITTEYIRSVVENELEGKTILIGKTGLLYQASTTAEIHVLVRVDIDALPISEENTFEWKSKHEGISHKCGHDGHTTIGIGLIEKLINEPLENVSVSVLFQPAEETGEGAKSVLDDPEFSIDHYTYALALHNIPGQEIHQVILKKGGFTPSVQSLVLNFKGVSSHAAEPENGTNPSFAIAAFLMRLKELELNDINSSDYSLITPVHVNIGETNYGISPGEGQVHLTLRAWTEQKMATITAEIIREAHQLAEKNSLELTIEKLAVFAANNNHEYLVDCIQNAAVKLNLNHRMKSIPFTWGEDFGLFSQKMPGAMFGLGAGLETPPLHNPSYDFPDDIISTGVNLFYETCKIIGKNGQ